MKNSIVILFILITGFCQAQEKGIIEGIVLDKQMYNEPLAFASITLKESDVNTTANIDGAYIFEIKEGVYTLVFNFPGYEKIEINNVIVTAGKITSIKNIALPTRQLVLSEVVVAPKKEK